MVMVVIIKHHMAHAKTQYQYANFSMDGYGCHHQTSYGPCQNPIPICQFQYGWLWLSSSNIIWPMPKPNTNMPISVWMVMVVIIKHHMAHAKTQYQYTNFSMDGYGCHHQTSYGPCQDPIPIHQ